MTARAPGISWTGEFIDPVLEQTFAETTKRMAKASARLCMIATTLTCLGFVPLDVMTLPAETLPFFLGDRLLIAFMSAAALAALAKATTYRRIVAISHAHQFAFFTLNALIFNHPVLLRHGGALLPLIAIALFMCMPGRFRRVAPLCAFAPGISLLFWGVTRVPAEAPLDLAIIILLTVVAFLVGGAARSQLNRMQREEYLHIERERQTNQTLLEAKDAAEAGALAKADFLAVMSHEIRTPMNGILGMVRLVLDSPLADEDRDRLETACQSAEGLQTILDDILDLSKLEAGRVEYESAPFQLRRTVEAVTALMDSPARKKGLTLALDISPQLPEWVIGDAARLRQILLNLIGNAVKFTETGGLVVRAEAMKDPREGTDAQGRIEVEFAVTDTGIGIAEAQRARIFQAFSQADASISRRFGGTGLGLVICKKMVEGLGGTIGVDSTPGRGSCFHFRLAFTPAQPPAPEAALPEPAHCPPLSVLVAEDNLVNQQVALAFLEKAGHRVTLAADGAEAVEQARSGAFDLILMDMQMPKVDGLEATRRIRALPGSCGTVPIIALTANAMQADNQRCRAAGMNGYIAKPVERRVLLSTIAQIMGKTTPAHDVAYCFDVLVAGNENPAFGSLLSRLGHRVFPAADPAVAVTMLQARQFDVIMVTGPPMDASMPDFIARLRAACAGRSPPPVILAATTHEAGTLRIAGADDILPDAMTAAQLSTIISRHMGDRGMDDPYEMDTLFGPERMSRLRALLAESLRQQNALLDDGDPTAEKLIRIAHRIKGSAANMRLKGLQAEADWVLQSAEKAKAAPEELDAARVKLRTAIHTAIVDTEARLSVSNSQFPPL